MDARSSAMVAATVASVECYPKKYKHIKKGVVSPILTEVHGAVELLGGILRVLADLPHQRRDDGVSARPEGRDKQLYGGDPVLNLHLRPWTLPLVPRLSDKWSSGGFRAAVGLIKR